MTALRRLRLFVAATLLLPLVRLALHVVPFGVMWRATNRLARARSAGPGPGAEAIAWAVSAAGRRVPGGHHCLAQAVTAYILLGRAGHSARVRFGLSRDGPDGLSAHAWVEREGSVLLGGPDISRFALLPPLETAPR